MRGRATIMYATARSRKGAGQMKKVIGWIVLILVIFYIGTNPGPAADIAQGIGHGLADAFRNIGVFLRNLAS
ncbi:hypothetical protein [Actinoplanes sp. NPDC051411]|uniref:hypothetical protein n=1 Tax=Actinoplanes sp. NPDC051411 TaxID=3155522 RepID=UPI00343DB3D1